MVLGKLRVPRRPTYLDYRVGEGSTALTVGASGGCLDIFISFLSPSLRETARYRLKYYLYLKGPLSPKQPTNPSLNLMHNQPA